MHSYSIELGGRTLTMEIGKIAKQANACALWRHCGSSSCYRYQNTA